MSTRNFCGSGNIGVVAYSENKQRKIKTEIRRDCTKMVQSLFLTSKLIKKCVDLIQSVCYNLNCINCTSCNSTMKTK